MADKQINFHYIKGQSFRTAHVDGFFGGPSPKGDCLHIAAFSERYPIPLVATHALEEQDDHSIKVGNELERVSRDGLVRELEIQMIMSVDTARILRDWLDKHIALHDQIDGKPTNK